MRSAPLRTAIIFSAITLFAVLVYWDLLSYRTFGCEFPAFYVADAGNTFEHVLNAYRTNLYFPWYRPSTFDLFYWAGNLIVGWHDVLGWKILEFSAALICSFLIYWLVLVMLPKQRLAAAIAAIYFIASPNLYNVVLETQGLDFNHIIFCLLCVILFVLAFRSTGWRTVVLTLLSLLNYALALSAKELTIVTPLYLTVVAGILLFMEGDKKRVLRTGLQLLPFFLLIGAYWIGHIQRIPKDVWGGTGDYRMQFNLPAVIKNLKNYPLWIVRLYGVIPDHQAMLGHVEKWWSNLPAGIAVLTVIVIWLRNIRKDTSLRVTLLLLLAWIAIFLIVPVYSGGYSWHANLAMVGYAVLFGYAFAYLLQSIPAVPWHRAAVCAFVLGFFLLARANVWGFLHESHWFHLYRLNYMALNAPPLKPGLLAGPGKPLIYIENRLDLNTWAYGGGNFLFKYIYLNKNIEEISVPTLATIPKALCTEWEARPRAYFVYYDNLYRWWDGTERFRAYCRGKT